MCLLLSAISIWLYLDVLSLNCPPLLIKHSIDVPSTFSNLYLALPRCTLLEHCYPSRPHMTRHSPLVGPFRIVLACYLFWQMTLPFPVFFSWIESVFSCHFFLSQALTDQIPGENNTEEKKITNFKRKFWSQSTCIHQYEGRVFKTFGRGPYV